MFQQLAKCPRQCDHYFDNFFPRTFIKSKKTTFLVIWNAFRLYFFLHLKAMGYESDIDA